MKKKPPPGATLIARLKERRMERDGLAQPIAEVIDHAVDDETTGSIISVGLIQDETVDIPALAPPAGLIQRAISIEDLKPLTEDYIALTEEIRLAGRFAAVGLIAQGLRLALMHSAEIHKEHYGSFEEYCRKEHRMSATYAYRLMRMAEMAEKMAERGAQLDRNKDPFENMLYLGHRHIMALLPLPDEQAEEFLVEGIPASGNEKRIPIGRATEKQIKAALGSPGNKPEKLEQTINAEKELSKLVSALERYAQALEKDMFAEQLNKPEEFQQLLERFKAATERITRGLHSYEP